MTSEVVQLQRVFRRFALGAQGPEQAKDHTFSRVSSGWYPTVEVMLRETEHIRRDPENSPGVRWFVIEQTDILLDLPTTERFNDRSR